MKTKATSDISGSTLQAGLVTIPARLVRTGVVALAMTAVAMGFFGAGSAFADAPRTSGQLTTTQVPQSPQTTLVDTTSNDSLGKVVTSGVMYVKAGATGQGVSQKQCDALANFINEVQGLALDAANLQRQYEAEELNAIAEELIDGAMNNGCFILY
jgi:hypothetical protein